MKDRRKASIVSTGLARAWGRTNVETAKKLLADPTVTLNEAETAYLRDIIERGETFLRLTDEYNRKPWYDAKRLSSG